MKGHFNPYIITPEWLLRSSIISTKDKVDAVFRALAHGVAFRIDRFQWEVDFDHLSISTQGTENCGALAEQLLKALPHTPVRAVGHNFEYACSLEEWGNGPMPMLGQLGPGALRDVGDEYQVRWTGVFSRRGTRLEMTVAHGLGGAAVLFNFQRSIESTHAEDAAQAAGQFAADSAASKELIDSLLKSKVIS